MCGHVRNGASDSAVQQTARGSLGQFGGLAGDTRDGAAAVAASAFWWCKLFVKFVHHDFIIRQRLGEVGHLQGLISPEVLVRMDKPEGDCAIFSECVAAFLTVFGVPYEFVTVAVNPSEPEIFSHVFLYAVMPDGSRLPIDASHGAYPGWQVPTAHVSRRQVWDASGNAVPDRGSRFDGLHNYRRGLGDPCNYADPDYNAAVCEGISATPGGGGTYLDTSGYTSGFPTTTTGYSSPSGVPYSGPVYQAPSQSNAGQWATFASNMVKAGLTLAEINAIQPGTVVSANGAILRQNPGYAVGTPTGTLNLGTGLSTGALMIGGIVVVGILLMSMGRK